MMHITHTPPASTTEMIDVLALFPKCTACGESLSLLEPIETDPGHAFRLKHFSGCPTSPRAA